MSKVNSISNKSLVLQKVDFILIDDLGKFLQQDENL